MNRKFGFVLFVFMVLSSGFVFAQEVSLSVFGRAIEFQWLFAPITIIVSMIITTLACLYPVKKAMEIEPALVLKGE